MSRIFWDTNLFIYLLEDYGGYRKLSSTLEGTCWRGETTCSHLPFR